MTVGGKVTKVQLWLATKHNKNPHDPAFHPAAVIVFPSRLGERPPNFLARDQAQRGGPYATTTVLLWELLACPLQPTAVENPSPVFNLAAVIVSPSHCWLGG